MDILMTVLQVLLYVAAIVLLVVFTIVGIKMIKMLNKTDEIMDDVSDKVKSLDGVFMAIDKVSDGANHIADIVVSKLGKFINKLFKEKSKDKKGTDEEDG